MTVVTVNCRDYLGRCSYSTLETKKPYDGRDSMSGNTTKCIATRNLILVPLDKVPPVGPPDTPVAPLS